MENFILQKTVTPYIGSRNKEYFNILHIASMDIKLTWSSLLVKLLFLFSLLPLFISAIWIIFISLFKSQAGADGQPLITGESFLNLQNIQLFFFATVFSITKGATNITKDLEQDALTFYFSKPLKGSIYLSGKILSLEIFNIILCMIPSMILSLFAYVVLNEPRNLYYFISAIVYGLIGSIFISILSLSMSVLSNSKAINVIVWTSILIIPFIIGKIINISQDTSWGNLTNIFSILNILGTYLYKVPNNMPYYYPLISTGICILLIFIAVLFLRYKIEKLEVIN